MRAITFPKTGPDEWTNRETGVQITRHSGHGRRPGFEVWAPVNAIHRRRHWSYASSLVQAREWAMACVESRQDEIAAAYEAACREDAERMAKSEDDDLIHHWLDKPADCGVDVLRTPYTYGSPEWRKVTCKACLLSAPATIGA